MKTSLSGPRIPCLQPGIGSRCHLFGPRVYPSYIPMDWSRVLYVWQFAANYCLLTSQTASTTPPRKFGIDQVHVPA